MKLLVHKGKTSKIVQIFIQDSTSTTGAGKTGLTSGSTGLICYRARTDDGNAAGTQLVLSAGTRGTWSSGGFVEKDATNMPGVYELGLDNAGIATGADQVVYMLSGATGMAPLALEIQLIDFDPQDGVHLGLTALPNVASGSAGAIPTTGTGANQIAVDGAGNASANLVNIAGSAVSTTTAQLGVNAVKVNNVSAASVTTIDAVLGTTSANTPQTGDAYARLGAPAGASVSADIAAVKSDLDGGVALTASERNSTADAILNRDMSVGTDSGSTTVRTVRQALRFLRNKWAISGGTLTVYKEDDATSSWTATVTTDGTAQPIVSNDPAGP